MRTARCTFCRPSAEVSARSTSAQPQPTAKETEPERICSGSGNLCDWTMATSVGKQNQGNRSRAYSGLSLTSLKSKPRTLANSVPPRWSRKSPSISMPAKACTVTRTAGTGGYFAPCSVLIPAWSAPRQVAMPPTRIHFNLSLRGAQRRGNLDGVGHTSAHRSYYGDGIAALRSQ